VKLFSINRKDPYQVINLIFLEIIFFVFLYSAIFSPERDNYPLKSSYSSITGQPSISTGLSHGFSSIVRGKLEEAIEYNPYSIRLFTFFVIQFFMRIIIFFFIGRADAAEKTLAAKIDSFISSGWFLLFFYPLLKDMFKG
jgi:hypothetical protein